GWRTLSTVSRAAQRSMSVTPNGEQGPRFPETSSPSAPINRLLPVRPERVAGEYPFLNRFSFGEVSLHELGHALGSHTVIPRLIGVDDHRRPVEANAQTTNLSSVTGVWARAEIPFLELLFQHLPRRLARLGRAARGARTQKNVALIGADPQLGGHRLHL